MEVSSSMPSPDSQGNDLNPPKFPTILLPPCKVCNGKGSGLHYGVNTCEACKAFFRRCLTRQQSLKCPHKEFCSVLPGKKHACPSCRYKKCLALGMSKDAIKTGRCTHERKTQVIEEIQKLELQSKLREDGSLMPVNERNEDMDRVIKQLTFTHISQTYDKDFYENLQEIEEQFLQYRTLQHNLFGSRQPLPREMYLDIYNSTGLDIDGRRELIQRLLPMIEVAINSFINFARSIPGFTSIPFEDQTIFIRDGCFMSWVFMFGKLYNLDNDIFVFPYDNSIVLSFDDIAIFSDEKEVYNSILTIVTKVQKLDLTEEESVIAAALAMMLNYDDKLSRDSLQIKDASVDYLTETLQYLINKGHDSSELILPKIMDIITLSKNYEQWYRQAQLNVIKDAQGIKLPSNYLTLFGSSDQK